VATRGGRGEKGRQAAAGRQSCMELGKRLTCRLGRNHPEGELLSVAVRIERVVLNTCGRGTEYGCRPGESTADSAATKRFIAWSLNSSILHFRTAWTPPRWPRRPTPPLFKSTLTQFTFNKQLSFIILNPCINSLSGIIFSVI
jgi:hypothetical protein